MSRHFSVSCIRVVGLSNLASQSKPMTALSANPRLKGMLHSCTALDVMSVQCTHLALPLAEREKELEVQYYLYSPFFPPFLLSPLPPSRISFPHPSLPACGGGARARLHIAVLEREKKELERQTHLFPPLASPLPASLLPPSPLYPIPSHQHAEEVARARLHIAVVEREKKDLEGLRASAGPEMLGVQREKEEAEERVREMEGVVMQLKTREREVGDAVWRCGR
ncbi:unnamed protein product [Closterium sp. NIES-54]